MIDVLRGWRGLQPRRTGAGVPGDRFSSWRDCSNAGRDEAGASVGAPAADEAGGIPSG